MTGNWGWMVGFRARGLPFLMANSARMDSLGSYNIQLHINYHSFSVPANMFEHSFEPLKNDLLLRAARGGFIAV
jgi:hypothetical protein